MKVVSKTLRVGSGRRVRPGSSSASKLKAKSRIWLPYIKFSGKRLPNGRREWALSWRPARDTDFRNIWNNYVPLDKRHSRSW